MINRLLNEYVFSDEYLSPYIKNTIDLIKGKDVSLSKQEILTLKDTVELSYKIRPDLKTQSIDIVRTNLKILIDGLLKREVVFFEGDHLIITWRDFGNHKEMVEPKEKPSAQGYDQILKDEALYSINLKIESKYNILDFINENSDLISNFLFEEIYIKFNKTLIKKRSREDSLFKLKNLTKTDILNILIVAFPGSPIEEKANNFLTNYSLDPLLEIYKRLDD